MSQAGRERDPGEGASLEAMVDVVGYLRAELQSIREREQRREGRTAAFGSDAAPGAPPLDPPVQVQLDRLESTLAEGLAWIPERAGQLADREELAQLAQQLDGLRTSMTDRFDALQPPDLRPLLEHLDRIHQQIASLPVPDLHPVRERIEGLHHEIQALAPPDLEPVRARLDQLHQQIAGLPRADQVVGALAPQLDAVRDAMRPDGALDAIDELGASLRAQSAAISDLGAQVRQVLEPLAGRLDRLAESDSAVRDDLVLTTEVLVGLTQLTEASEQHLTELVGGQEAALLEQRALVASTFGDLSRTLADQVQAVESQLGTLITRVTAIEDNVSAHLHTAVTRIEDGLGAQLREQLGELGLTELRSSVATIAQRVDDARIDGHAVLEAVQAVDARLNELGLGQLPAAVAGLSQQIGASRSDDRMLVEAVRGLEARLDDIDPAPLGATVADLVQQVSAGRADHRMVAEAVRALDARVGDLDAGSLAPVRSGIDGLRTQIEALPAPDLRQVEAALARITTVIVSERRPEPATAEDLGTLGHSISEAIEAMGQLLDQQGQQTAALATRMEAVTAPTPSADGGQGDDDLRATLAQVVEEMGELRHAVERRSGSRWRRRGGSDGTPALDAELASSSASAIEQRLELALSEMDQRLATLSRQVERTAGHAIQAANAATAALEGVTAATKASEESARARPARSLRPWVDRPGAGAASSPTPTTAAESAPVGPSATAATAPAKKAAAGKATAKKAPAGKTAAKKAPAGKIPAKKTPVKKTPVKKTAVEKTAVKKTAVEKTAVEQATAKTRPTASKPPAAKKAPTTRIPPPPPAATIPPPPPLPPPPA